MKIEKEINYTPATNTSSQNMWQMPPAINLDSSGLRRSSQTEVLKQRDKVYSHTTQAHQASPLHVSNLPWCFSSICSVGNGVPSIAHSLQEKVTVTSLTQNSTFSKAIDSYHCVNLLYDGTINCFSTMAQASVSSNEMFTYKQAMREKDYHDFVKAMVKEVDDHKNGNHWSIMLHCNMPKDTKTIMSIWSFKRKRYPDGTLNKHKARLCAHGIMQTWGQNYWETYAPVVDWASVCLLLAIAKIHGLSSKSIDFVLAFSQADLEIPVYMESPIGFDAPNNEDQQFYILKLNKSFYGLKQAGYNWFAKLSNGLQDHGFVQSNIDPCIFFGQKCIVLTLMLTIAS